MSGDNRSREGEEGERWRSTLLKVASGVAATAAVAGGIYGLYALLKQPPQEPEPGVAFGALAVHNREADEPIVWTKPIVGWVKLNVDGSLLHESAGCGGVLRGASGEWLGGFAQKLAPDSTVDKTEKKAILEGLRWAMKRGKRKVMVESDNKGVVASVNNNGRRYKDPIIREIRELLKCDDWQASLTWIDRRANQVADKVADYARTLPSFALREFDSPPSKCIKDALSKDKQ